MNRANTYSNWRLNVLLVAVLGAAVVLIGRVVLLQLLDVDKGYRFLQNQGEQRFIRVVASAAPRGEIVDRHGHQLAISTPVVTLGANPSMLLADETGLRQLAAGLGLSEAALREKLAAKQHKGFIYLQRHMAPQDAQKLVALGAAGVRTEPSYRRYYPAGEVVAQVVGFNTVTDEGQEGLELAYNDYLKPESGRARVIQDLHGNTVRELAVLQEAKAGNKLALSIDLRVQYMAYTALAEAVKAAGAASGSLVLADAKTGEILALTNYPSYNPNNRRELRFEYVRNRAVTDAIEPGSTVKPFAVLAALEAGALNADALIDTSPGFIKVEGKTLQDSRNNGELSVAQILAKSSQVGITKIAMATDPFDMRASFEQLGVGVAVGTGFPGEALGRLPSYAQWRDIDRVTMAFGHGVSMSVLQLAQAYQVLANSGQKVPLTLLKRDKPEYTIQAATPANANAVLAMLGGTFMRGGTAASAALQDYALAGKTGTAHKVGGKGYLSNKYRSLFAGVAPAQAPRYVAVVMVDEPTGDRYYGGEIAAPVFSDVAAAVLPYLGVRPHVSPELEGLAMMGARP